MQKPCNLSHFIKLPWPQDEKYWFCTKNKFYMKRNTSWEPEKLLHSRIVTKETALMFFNNYQHQFHFLGAEFNLILEKPEKGLLLSREWPVIYILMVIPPACCFSNTVFTGPGARGCSYLVSSSILTGLLIGLFPAFRFLETWEGFTENFCRPGFPSNSLRRFSYILLIKHL